MDFNSIEYKTGANKFAERINIECKTAVSAEQVKKVLCVTPFITLIENSINENQIEYGGKATYYVNYLDSENNLKKCECGAEFSGRLKPEIEITNVFGFAKAVKTNTDLSGAYLTVGGTVEACFETTSVKRTNLFTAEQDVIVNQTTIDLNKSYGVKKCLYPIEEQFELNYQIEEVLSHKAESVITAVQCGIGAIIVDGVTQVSAIVLQKTQKRDIIKVTKQIPFRVEIEHDDATPEMLSVAHVKEKSCKIDIAVDEENSVSTVTSSITLAFEGEVFSSPETSVVTDAFSPDYNLELLREELTYNKQIEVKSFTHGANILCQVEIDPVTKIITTADERVEELVCSYADGAIKVTGVVSSICYASDGQTISTFKVEGAFEKVVEMQLPDGAIVSATARVFDAKARISGENQVELVAEIYFTVYPEEVKKQTVICGVNTLSEKQKNQSAISVYIPFEGEELWSIAKRLGVHPETVAKTNKELIFPLTGKERIVIYRQK